MLFQGMVIFLPISIFFKILSERGKVHCPKYVLDLYKMPVEGERVYFLVFSVGGVWVFFVTIELLQANTLCQFLCYCDLIQFFCLQN